MNYAGLNVNENLNLITVNHGLDLIPSEADVRTGQECPLDDQFETFNSQHLECE